MTPEQRAALDPNSREYYNRTWGSKIHVIGWSFYALILWLVQFCLAMFYSRLTTVDAFEDLRSGCICIIGCDVYRDSSLSILLGCRPLKKMYWQIHPDPGNICQPTNAKFYVLVVVIPNVLTDLYLLSIPLPVRSSYPLFAFRVNISNPFPQQLLWTVNIAIRRKITLMALFSGAAFVIMVAIIRALTILQSRPEGAIAGSEWACLETFVAIVVSNLLIIQPLVRRGCAKIGLSALFSTNGRPSRSYPPTSREWGTHTGGASQKRGGSRVGSTHPLASMILTGNRKDTNTTTAWRSDEHILRPDGEHGSSKEITVVQETTIQSEPWAMAGAGKDEGGANENGSAGADTAATRDWGHRRRAGSESNYYQTN